MTLEKTVNGHAASKTGGMTSFTNSIAARQRWTRSHIVRTSITDSMYDDDIGMVTKDVSSHLIPAKMKKNLEDIRNIMNSHIKQHQSV